MIAMGLNNRRPCRNDLNNLAAIRRMGAKVWKEAETGGKPNRDFCRIYKTLHVTPAMEAKLTTKPMIIEDVVNYTYADEIAKVHEIAQWKIRK